LKVALLTRRGPAQRGYVGQFNWEHYPFTKAGGEEADHSQLRAHPSPITTARARTAVCADVCARAEEMPPDETGVVPSIPVLFTSVLTTLQARAARRRHGPWLRSSARGELRVLRPT
jgi:hypothetical protein